MNKFPCIRCLHPKIKRIRAGAKKEYFITQCRECGFNVSGRSLSESKKRWEGFRVWELVDQSDLEKHFLITGGSHAH